MLLLPESGSLVRQDEERNDDSSKASLPGRRRGSNSRLPSLATLVSSLVIRSNIKFPLKIHFASETICKMTFYPLVKKRGKKIHLFLLVELKSLKKNWTSIKYELKSLTRYFAVEKILLISSDNLERLKVGSNNGFTDVTSYDTVKVSLEKKRRLLLNLRGWLKKKYTGKRLSGSFGLQKQTCLNKVNQIYPLC